MTLNGFEKDITLSFFKRISWFVKNEIDEILRKIKSFSTYDKTKTE